MDEPVNNTSPSDDEFDLLDYLIFLAKHGCMLINVSAAVTVLTYAYLFCAPNAYTAKARFLPPQTNLTLSAQLLDSLGGRVPPSAGGAGSPMAGMAASMLGIGSAIDLYKALMTSEPILDHIIARFHLMKLYKTIYLEDAQKLLIKNTNITGDNKEGIIDIALTSSTPMLAAEMANAFIEGLDRLLQELAVQEAKGRATFLEKERLQASQNLAKAEESVRLFSEKNSVLQIDTQTKVAIEYIARLRAEIDVREVSLQVLGQRATPLNYEVSRLATEIKGLKEKLRSAESQLENCVSDVCLPAGKAPGLGLEYLRLLREAKFQESLYELYTRLVELSRLDMVRDVNVVKVVAPAMPPARRSNKRLKPSILVGIATFLMMIFVAWGREYMQNMNNRENDVQRLSMLKGHLRTFTDMLIKKRPYLR